MKTTSQSPLKHRREKVTLIAVPREVSKHAQDDSRAGTRNVQDELGASYRGKKEIQP